MTENQQMGTFFLLANGAVKGGQMGIGIVGQGG